MNWEGMCNKCGRPPEEHGIDPYTGEPTKCPVYRQEDRQRPGGDY